MTPSESPNALDGHWAVVTGSTSGIGRAIALELAAAGANVVVHGRDQRRADETCADIRKLKRQAVAIVTDLADASALDELVESIWRERPIDVWVNNAGIDVLTGDAASWPFARKLTALWEVDMRATVELSRAVGRRMFDRGHGAIVNMGWDQVDTGMAGDSGEMFAAVKGAVMAFSRSLAQSLAPHVRVNCVAPGWIRTAWGETASDAWQIRAVGESLLQRWGEPEDVARVVRFLASPYAAFVNGQTIAVNGGRAGP